MRQVEFIGRGGSWGYGGVAGYQAALKLATLIAADIYENRSGYERAASSALPLLREIPSRNAIESRVFPFREATRWEEELVSRAGAKLSPPMSHYSSFSRAA